MKLLLDNCVDIHAKTLFGGHTVEHVLDRGWDALGNGRLLAATAAVGFDALVTVDKNLRYQQNLEQLPLTVIELDVFKNRIDQLSEIARFIPRALEQADRFRFVSVKTDGTTECLGDRRSGG